MGRIITFPLTKENITTNVKDKKEKTYSLKNENSTLKFISEKGSFNKIVNRELKANKKLEVVVPVDCGGECCGEFDKVFLRSNNWDIGDFYRGSDILVNHIETKLID